MASTYTMVAYGSQGSAVRQLQNELNKRGYSLDQDGIFGKKTRAAVRDYQKKNGLTMVDGIAGDETWGSLLSAPTAAEQAAQAAAAAEAAAPRAEVTAGTARRLQELERGYTPSDEVTAAQAYRDSVAALEPEAYRSRFEERLQALYDQIAGREAFDYDPEEDESYQRYARLYAARGAAAMEEARGAWQEQLEAAQAAYEDAGSQDQKLYQTLLAHFSDKAEQERKLSASGVRLTDSGDTGSRGESLSSTAAESLQRAVGNYLKRGNGDLAQALAAQYTARMTPAQRQRLEKLLGQYGMTLA